MPLKLQALRRHRPRLLTLVVLLAIAAIIVLSNLSFEDRELTRAEMYDGYFAAYGRQSVSKGKFYDKSYGWPLTWHRYVTLGSWRTIGWYYSPNRLAGDAAVWLTMLVAPAGGCEWLLRRYRPGPRWTLRTMLAVVAVLAAGCAWVAAERNRIRLQDPLIAEIDGLKGKVWLDRAGPRWLDLLRIDKFRRHVVAVSLGPQSGFGSALRADDPNDCDILKRLARLPRLRYLHVSIDHVTPEIAATLGEMRNLRELNIVQRNVKQKTGRSPRSVQLLAPLANLARLERLQLSGLTFDKDDGTFLDSLTSLKSLNLHSVGTDDARMSRRCFAAVGKLTRLEELGLTYMPVGSDSLAWLAGLTNLKSLSLGYVTHIEEPDSDASLLSRLPALPQLETMDLSSSAVCDVDLRYLAVLPRLKSACLVRTLLTDSGLAELASVKSLEELAIDGDSVSPAGIRALCALTRLRLLHISRDSGEESGRVAALALDGNDVVHVPEAVLDESVLAMQALRESNRGIVLDNSVHLIPMGLFTWAYDPYMGSGRDGFPERGARYSYWLPASDAPWMTTAERAAFEADGWANFDAAGWRSDNGRITKF